MPSTRNSFDDPKLVAGYEDWYGNRGRRANRLEKHLLGLLLTDFPKPATVLEVGCGTGHFTRWIAELGYFVVGLDISKPMLLDARSRDGLPYVLGDADALPIKDRAFDLTTLITTLEFVPDPQCALREAVRVSARGVILGVLNRHSVLAVQRRMAGRPPWDTARFYSPNELSLLLKDSAGERLQSPRWRTTLWPPPIWGSLHLPWGGFIGMEVKLH